MRNKLAKEMVCILWIPTYKHEKPTRRTNTVRKFRISDYQISEDENGYFELCGEVKPSHPDSGSNHDIDIHIYKNTARFVIFLLRILNWLQTEELLNKTRCVNVHKIILSITSWIVNKIRSILIFLLDNIPLSAAKLTKVHIIRLRCIEISDNGMMCFSYDCGYPQKRIYNILNDGKLPECIYHNIKVLYHKHQFHDKEQDASLQPLYLEKRKFEDIRNKKDGKKQVLKKAIEHYLYCFNDVFNANTIIYENFYQKINTNYISIYIRSKRMLFIVVILHVLLICTYFCSSNDTLKLMLILVAIYFCFILFEWKIISCKYIITKMLQIEGQYRYAQALIHSRYNSNKNNNCRKRTYNIRSNYCLSKAFLETTKKRTDADIVLISIWITIIAAIISIKYSN